MLFTPQDQTPYRLWSTRRCGWVLLTGVLLFLLFIFICFSLIMIRPSLEVKSISVNEQSVNVIYKNKQEYIVHNFNTIEQVRFITSAGTAEIMQVTSIMPFKLDGEHIPEHKAAFVICSERSVWKFLWQRWQLMWNTPHE